MAVFSRSRKNEIDEIGNFYGKCVDFGNSKDEPHKKVPQLSGVALWLSIIAFHTIILFYVYLVNGPAFSPEPRAVHGARPTEFVEERVREHLITLTSFGFRTVGSYANEHLAKSYILQELEVLHANTNPSHKMEIDVQNVSGTFTLKFLGEMSHVYENMKNIVVKFSPARGSNHSLLVNCHYDTFPHSPGASDDAVSCCVMLETLRAFTQEDTAFKHNIIFLFNGGEENLMQASHGFITQHRWAREVRAFVNLDAAGAGGREIVFQSGPEHPWLMKAYAEAAVYPFASVLGQEVFQSGLIPADTDFRVFRDYGHIPGLDIAYISNGYVYHTQYDLPEMIPDGCIQRAGENMMALLRELGNSPLLPDPGDYKHGSMVFFDVASLFMVVYPRRIGTLVNSLAITLVILAILNRARGNSHTGLAGKAYLRLLSAAVAAIIVTWVLILVVMVTTALVMTKLGRSMSWYTNVLNMEVLYVVPPVFVCLLFHQLLKTTVFKAHNPWLMERLYFEAGLSFWSVVTAAMTWGGLCSAYLPMLWVLLPILIRDKLLHLLHITPKEKQISYVVVHLMSLLVPTWCTCYTMYSVMEVFVPIMGRGGTEIPPDIPISILVFLGLIPCLTYQIGLVYISDQMAAVLKGLGVFMAVTVSLLLLTPLGFPFKYSPQKPVCQRLIILHMDRVYHDLSGEATHTDVGILFFPFDYIGGKLINETVPMMATGTPLSCRGPYCGIPYYFPIIEITDARKTLFFPTLEQLRVDPRVKLHLASRQKLTNHIQRLTFLVTGPDHITVYVTPRQNVTLMNWSLGEGLPHATKMPADLNQTTYFIFYSYAEKPSLPWQFYLDLQTSDEYADASEPILDIAFSGHYLHDKYSTTSDLEAFVKVMPDWTVTSKWVATYDSWVF